MNFNEYQERARKTRGPSSAGAPYAALGLTGEAGEVAQKIKKLIRDKGGQCGPEDRDALAAELGDVLWYLAALADDLGYSMADIAAGNLAKIARRQAAGTIGGSGDER